MKRQTAFHNWFTKMYLGLWWQGLSTSSMLHMLQMCLRQELQGAQLADAWRVSLPVHFIRKEDYRGRKKLYWKAGYESASTPSPHPVCCFLCFGSSINGSNFTRTPLVIVPVLRSCPIAMPRWPVGCKSEAASLVCRSLRWLHWK